LLRERDHLCLLYYISCVLRVVKCHVNTDLYNNKIQKEQSFHYTLCLKLAFEKVLVKLAFYVEKGGM